MSLAKWFERMLSKKSINTIENIAEMQATIARLFLKNIE
jgi:hypothetical protein